MSKALEVFQEVFGGPRGKRSDEYQKGVLDVLRFRLNETNDVWCPYELGTASADAYFAGCEEGHLRAKEHLEKDRAGATATDLEITR